VSSFINSAALKHSKSIHMSETTQKKFFVYQQCYYLYICSRAIATLHTLQKLLRAVCCAGLR